MAVTLQGILNAAHPAYAATHRLPLHVHKAVSVLRRCRTGELGRNAVKCTGGHVLAVRRNSCRHRACPQCGWGRAERWLRDWQTRLLPTTHFHVIFTVASELHGLWQWNRKGFADVLFDAARDALCELLGQDRHLGAWPGLLLALHTWGSPLPVHLHLHGLVTAGGVGPDGRWVRSRPHFLIWGPILRDVFRQKVLAGLGRLLDQGLLYLPPTLSVAAARALLAQLEHRPWHVRIEPPYASGKGLVVYLARYLRRGADQEPPPGRVHRDRGLLSLPAVPRTRASQVAPDDPAGRGVPRPPVPARPCARPADGPGLRSLRASRAGRLAALSAPTAAGLAGTAAGPARAGPLPALRRRTARGGLAPALGRAPASSKIHGAGTARLRHVQLSVGAADAVWHTPMHRDVRARRGSNAETLGRDASVKVEGAVSA
ncbi:MAG TPA: transposase [Candidatus Acidoferrales bacterium]|nr:transposase [Candidatus Acidoferrales bacterium]